MHSALHLWATSPSRVDRAWAGERDPGKRSRGRVTSVDCAAHGVRGTPRAFGERDRVYEDLRHVREGTR